MIISREENLPKYLKIRDILAQRIEDKVYKIGEKLPPIRELSTKLGASYLTIVNALKALEKDNTIHLKPRKGYFVKNIKEKIKNEDYAKIGFLIPKQGDLYQNIFDLVSSKLLPENIFSIPLLPSFHFDKVLLQIYKERMIHSINTDFSALVVEGNRHFPYKDLKVLYEEIKQVIFILSYTSEIQFPGSVKILCDFEQVGYLAAKELFKNGEKEIVYLCYTPLDEKKQRILGIAPRDYNSQVIDGFEKAYKEYGYNFFENFYIVYDEYNTEFTSQYYEHLRANILKKRNVFCLGDFRAKKVYKIASEEGLVIGKDFKVLGLFNTPICEYLTPSLSSISIDEQEVSALVSQAILEEWQDKEVIISPKMISRESTY